MAACVAISVYSLAPQTLFLTRAKRSQCQRKKAVWAARLISLAGHRFYYPWRI